MKKLPSSYEIMEMMMEMLNEAYQKNDMTANGHIQFNLTYENSKIECYLEVTPESLVLKEGTIENPTVSLSSTLYDFLDMASEKLNPVVGVMLRKLKFKGNIFFFKKVLQQKNLFDIDLEIPKDDTTKHELVPRKNWEKPKKILVLNASARTAKGYTEFYFKPFLEGLQSCDTEVEMVYLDKVKIKNCKGCWYCWTGSDGDCIYDGNDEFKELLDKHENADMIVYALPLYTDGMPASLKNFFDRSVRVGFPYLIDGKEKIRHPRREVKKQSMVIFSVCGFLEKENFNALEQHFKQISYNKHIPIITQIFRTSSIYLFNNPLLYRNLNEVTDATREAAIEIFNHGKVKKRTYKKITQTIDTSSRFKKIGNFFWNKKIKDKEKNY